MSNKINLEKVTALPGIYMMLNAAGQVLYVGKAKNLKRRLASYFRQHVDTPKIRLLVSQVTDVQVLVAHNEVEALLLENNFIKQYKPPFNVVLRDDKTYPYLYLSTQDSFPRLTYYRGRQRKKGRYFGPYPAAFSAKQTESMLQKLFKVRSCNNAVFACRSRPCLQYQIGRCSAPCVGYISEEDYAKSIEYVTLFLSGRDKQLMDVLVEKMDSAAQSRDYEQACVLRNQITHLRTVCVAQSAQKPQGEVDVLGLVHYVRHCVVMVLYVRQGRVMGHKECVMNTPLDASSYEVLTGFVSQYYTQAMVTGDLPGRILMAYPLKKEEAMALQRRLSFLAKKKLSVSGPSTEDEHAWVRLLKINLNSAGGSIKKLHEKDKDKWFSLEKELGLSVPLQSIVCFDISHSAGQYPVGACVVFTHAGPQKSAYRRFHIKTACASDDYGAMREALMRYFTGLVARKANLPGLCIVDGGKGQWGVANTVLAQLALDACVPVLGIAKGPTRQPGKETLIWEQAGACLQVHWPAQTAALHLLQQIRDEAHRFALYGHRTRRRRAMTLSSLQNVPGIGPLRAKAILLHFGGWQQVLSANIGEMTAVPGISRRLATELHIFLNKDRT